MIIWINGAFGVGKTHTAYELSRRITDSFIFDPEEVGFFLNKVLPKAHQYSDFQNNPLWKVQVLENLLFCDENMPFTIIPMTVVNDEIFDFIIGGLKNKGINIKHFSLIASKKTIEKRLIGRGDKNSWNFRQVDRCLTSLNKEKYKIQIDTENNNLDEVVEIIADTLNLRLDKPRLNLLEKKVNWFRVILKNLRFLS